MAIITLRDAALLTGAANGSIISEAQNYLPAISPAAVTKLVSLINQMKTDGALTGTPAHLISVNFGRVLGDLSKVTVSCTLNAPIVYADALTAVRQRLAYPGVTQEILGEVTAALLATDAGT
jgi:hypothetical protein